MVRSHVRDALLILPLLPLLQFYHANSVKLAKIDFQIVQQQIMHRQSKRNQSGMFQAAGVVPSAGFCSILQG